MRTAGPGGLPQVINAVEAEVVVRRIFAEAAAGIVDPHHCPGAERRRHPLASQSSQWNASTLVGTATLSRGLLRNPVYCGCIVFGRTKIVRNPATNRREVHLQPETEWTTTERA